MKKIVVMILVGFLIFVVAAIIRDPETVLPMRQMRNLSKSYTPCPDPFVFEMPVGLGRATSILYPGQERGGNYKAHGGFRFDGSRPDEITVRAPYDAEVIAGARYPVNGEIQYTFDFAHPCGIRYRFGHLLTLAPKFQDIADKFPLPKDMDSRTTEVYPGIAVKQGEVIATAVGLTRGGPDQLGGLNTFVDWGVYDYRKKNEASKHPDWLAKHPSEIEQYAVCWFDWIRAEDRRTVLALPSSDSQSGKMSDYCQ